jgi:hypothetical protein
VHGLGTASTTTIAGKREKVIFFSEFDTLSRIHCGLYRGSPGSCMSTSYL